MKKRNVLIALSMLFVIVLSACSATTGATQIQPQISVSGNGKVYITPDLAYVNIGVHSEAPVVTDAVNQNNQQAQAIASAMTALGVDAKDIQTSAFNVYPKQEFGPNGEVTNTVYAVDNTVNVTVRDLASLGNLLDAVVKAGANTINSISFDAQDKTAAYSEARRLAVEDARTQADELATAAGVKVGKVLTINASTSSAPIPAYDVKAYPGQGGSSSVAVAAGQLVISIDAYVTFDIQ